MILAIPDGAGSGKARPLTIHRHQARHIRYHIQPRGNLVEPITLIVAALAAGASSGAIEELAGTAKENARAAFAKLRELTRRRFEGNASAEVILSEYQDDPAAYEAPLAKKLAGAGAADDTELLAAAKALMELVDQTGASSGRYNVTINNSKGVRELARDATAALNRALGGNLSDPLTLIAMPALFLETIAAGYRPMLPAERCVDDCLVLAHPYAQFGLEAEVRIAALTVTDSVTASREVHGSLEPRRKAWSTGAGGRRAP